MTLDELKYGLRQAIKHGLQLAIFNSCDGLGLAYELEKLHLPQLIVMRERVPDKVAQEFLKHFLNAYASGDLLYVAERKARERLQGLEGEFPCATWLPVIFQNSTSVPPTWQGLVKPPLREVSTKPASLNLSLYQSLVLTLLSSWVVTSLVMGVRLTGHLQQIELWAFDWLMRSRPVEQPDDRILLVTVDEKDLTYQKQQKMVQQGSSLSDEALNQLLKKLQPYKPAAIGLDIYRDRPVSLRTKRPQNPLATNHSCLFNRRPQTKFSRS